MADPSKGNVLFPRSRFAQRAVGPKVPRSVDLHRRRCGVSCAPDNFQPRAFALECFVDGASEFVAELSPSLGTRHCGVQLNVENVSPPTTDLNLGKVRVTIVGQDLRDGRSRRFVISAPATKLLLTHPNPDCVARMAWNRYPVSPLDIQRDFRTYSDLLICRHRHAALHMPRRNDLASVKATNNPSWGVGPKVHRGCLLPGATLSNMIDTMQR